MRIRSYVPEDRDFLVRITLICFDGVSIDQNVERKFGKVGGTDWKFRKARHIIWDIEANPEGIFVAEEDGRPVGYVTTRLDHDTKIGWIPNLAVLPEHRRKGIGKALMERALNYLKEKGMEMVKIETLEQNEVGKEFYPKVGFVEVARQIHYVMPLGER
ncbi:MAG TPA: GNAT family N-acetyltransferase [Candidatus Latescibacteria bacterium]|nr:GNAT family N-acetyltransferase [Candidatus Latescibacterota bacterium]